MNKHDIQTIIDLKKFIKEKKYKSALFTLIQTPHLKKIVENNSIQEITNFSQKLHFIVNELKEIPKCHHCLKNAKFISFQKGYLNSCGQKCSSFIKNKSNEITHTKQELTDYCFDYMKNKTEKGKYKSLVLHVRRNQNLFDTCNKRTEFLDKYGSNINERLYCLLNNLNDKPKCNREGCNNKTKFINMNLGYTQFCSQQCSAILFQTSGYINLASKEFLIDYIKDVENNNTKIGMIERVQSFYDSLLYYTSYLNKYNPRNSERLYCLINDIKDRPTCLQCDNKVNFSIFERGYNEFCCSDCGSKSEITQQRKITTSLTRYGTNHPMQNANVYFNNRESQITYTEYKFKTGEVVKVQGYESYALKLLEEQGYTFDDIETQVDLNLWYDDVTGKRIYYPDIYIKSENTIIEVKSEYIFNCDIETNFRKALNVIYSGYKYEIWFFDNKNLIKVL